MNQAECSAAAGLIEMVSFSGGSFLMGSPDSDGEAYSDERPQRRVEVAAFRLGKYPVTQAQWRDVMGTSPSRFSGDDRPVERVSWDDARAFCERLSNREGRIGVDRYRLPTAAEWEYACRAGTTSSRYGAIDEVAWHYGNAGDSTHPVGEKLPNAFGLYDMLGNVWEWCGDGDGAKAIRGGSWFSYARNVRAARRSANVAACRGDSLGFRVARGPAGAERTSPAERSGSRDATNGPVRFGTVADEPQWKRARVKIMGNVEHVGSYRYVVVSPGASVLEVREERPGFAGYEETPFVYGPSALYRLEHLDVAPVEGPMLDAARIRAKIAERSDDEMMFFWSEGENDTRVVRISSADFSAVTPTPTGHPREGVYWVSRGGRYSRCTVREWLDSCADSDARLEEAVMKACPKHGLWRPRCDILNEVRESTACGDRDIDRVIDGMVEKWEIRVVNGFVGLDDLDIPF